MSFLKTKTWNFLLLFLLLGFEWSTYCLLSKIRIIANASLDWLIWLVQQFWLVRLNKHQLVQILLIACSYYQSVLLITRLRGRFRINWKFLNCPIMTRAISNFQKSRGWFIPKIAQTCNYSLITPSQQTLCIVTNIF